MRQIPKHTIAMLAFIVALFMGQFMVASSSAHAAGFSSKIYAKGHGGLPACMARCRAQAKACYKSGQTGSCNKKRIKCFASCQGSINSSFKNNNKR